MDLAVFVITKDGWKQHYRGDMNELHYGQYAAEKAKDAAAAAAAKKPEPVEDVKMN